ncbi:MAG: glycosyltransferase family 1 protein [Planctomycetes bacterium]|nr:glycosyltransferase family 1 protein [Planctomycetota bacterium]
MLILMITTNDPAGSAFNLLQAVNANSDHTCRLITTETRYNFFFRKDIHIPLLSDYSEIEFLLKNADVFHFHMIADENMTLGPFRIKEYINNKIIIHHHHGEPPFRENPSLFRVKELALNRTAIVSTPDLQLLYPEATWLPNAVPLNDILYLPALPLHNDQEKFVITHSPTRRYLKNTDEFIETVNMLKIEGYPVAYKIIEKTPHEICLRTKRTSDIFFDHIQGYYGISSLEALSQGVACIAGLSDHTLRLIKEFTKTDEHPWVIAKNKVELRSRIIELLTDRKKLAHYKEVSRKWMLKYWNESKVAAKYIEVLNNSLIS